MLQVGEKKNGSIIHSHPFNQINLLCQGVISNPPFSFFSQQSPLSWAVPHFLSHSPVGVGIPTYLQCLVLGSFQPFCDCLGQNSPPKAEPACSLLHTTEQRKVESASLRLPFWFNESCPAVNHLICFPQAPSLERGQSPAFTPVLILFLDWLEVALFSVSGFKSSPSVLGFHCGQHVSGMKNCSIPVISTPGIY